MKQLLIQPMKTLPILILLIVTVFTSCDQETPTPANPISPAPASVKLDLGLIHFGTDPLPATPPKIIAISPTGDTIGTQIVSNSDINIITDANYNSSDSAACNAHISYSVTYPLQQNGSSFKVYIYSEGNTLYKTLKVEYLSTVDLGTMGGFNQCPSNYHRVVVWW